MAIIRWEPWRELENFFDEPRSLSGNMGWDLAVDVYEEGDKVVAKMQLPGVNPEKVEVIFEDDYLMRIAGSREEKQEIKERHYYSKEIRQGSFERLVRLPCPVDQSKAEAAYEDGVLTVTVLKKGEEQKPTVKIDVKKSGSR